MERGSTGAHFELSFQWLKTNLITKGTFDGGCCVSSGHQLLIDSARRQRGHNPGAEGGQRTVKNMVTVIGF